MHRIRVRESEYDGVSRHRSLAEEREREREIPRRSISLLLPPALGISAGARTAARVSLLLSRATVLSPGRSASRRDSPARRSCESRRSNHGPWPRPLPKMPNRGGPMSRPWDTTMMRDETTRNDRRQGERRRGRGRRRRRRR